jgi:hypothetical protein
MWSLRGITNIIGRSGHSSQPGSVLLFVSPKLLQLFQVYLSLAKMTQFGKEYPKCFILLFFELFYCILISF